MESKLDGIFYAQDLLPEFNELRRGGQVRETHSTGYDNLDHFFKLAKGYLMVVTGIPSMGKSEFVDSLAVNTAIQHDWKWAFFSPENYPVVEHMAKIIEKVSGKRLDKLTVLDAQESTQFIKNKFAWIYPPDDQIGLKDIFDRVKQVKDEMGLDVVVLDPWNEVQHNMRQMRDDQYLAKALRDVRRFARKEDILVIVVAHPNKTEKKDNSYLPPTLYDLNGGAMWRNKADYGVCVHRESMDRSGVTVFIQKIKFKWMGCVGMANLDYDVHSGRFKNPLNPYFSLPTASDAPF